MASVDDIKRHYHGRWAEVLCGPGGLPADIIDGEHHPCPKCGGSNRFRVFNDFADTGGVFCNQCFSDSNSDGIAVYGWLFGRDFTTTMDELAQRAGLNGYAKSSKAKAAAPEVLDKAYRSMLALCPLSTEHHDQLRRRGFDEDEIVAGGYGTLDANNHTEIVAYVKSQVGGDFARIPGFVAEGDGAIVGRAGLLIPVRNRRGQIVAMRVRRDNATDGKSKYFWLSSGKKGGASCGVPVHYPPGVSEPVDILRVTEGEIKAHLATAISGIPTLSFAGVNAWREVIPELQALKPRVVRLAFDADCVRNEAVAKCMVQSLEELPQMGFTVELEQWDEETGKGIDDLLQSGELPSVVPMPTALGQARQLLEGITGKTAEPPRIMFPIVTAAQLLSSNYELKWHIRSLLTKGQPATICGPKKALKTSLALYMSICLATRVRLFDRFEVPHSARVAFMSAESGAHTIQETVNRICDEIGVVDGDYGTRAEQLAGLSFCWNVPRFDNMAHLVELEKFIDATQSEIVFFDPTYMTMGGADAGNIFEMGERLRNVSELCSGRGVTPILIHHFKKARAETDSPDLGDMAWSGFAEFSRQWILLDRERGEEYVPGSGQHKLIMTWGGSAGHSGSLNLEINEGVNDGDGGRIWKVDAYDRKGKQDRREEARQTAFEKQVAERTDAIDAAFRSAKDHTLTKRDLTARSGKGKAWDDAFARLLRKGAVEECCITKSGGRALDAYRRIWGKGEVPDDSL